MADPRNDFVTIVSGMPRTGTSMTMQMIEAGGVPALIDGIRENDEDNPKGYYEFEAVKQTKSDPSWLARAPGKVVKMVYRLLEDLPADGRYRVVYTRRDIDEVLASQNVMLERQGRSGGGLSMDEFRRVFQADEQRVRDWLAKQPNFRVLDVNYNELLAGPRPIVEAIDGFLGGGLDVDAMTGVVDPSLYRNKARTPGVDAG